MSLAGNIVKMLVGIVILISGALWYTGVMGYLGYWEDLMVLLKGSFGIFLLFVGLIVAWMGYDDYNMDKEMSREKKKEEKS